MSVQEFKAAVAHYLKGLDAVSPGPCPGCEDCGLVDVDTMDDPRYEEAGEGGFSWQQCDSCGSTLGGDRSPAHCYNPDTKTILHLDVCVDCVMYLANGDVPEEWNP